MRRTLAVACLFGLLAFAPAALSASRYGSAGPNHLRGTPAADRLIGRGGPDLIEGRGGGDTIDGGVGNDTVRGGRLVGVGADDRIAGESTTRQSQLFDRAGEVDGLGRPLADVSGRTQ